jgi:hypothetical protein
VSDTFETRPGAHVPVRLALALAICGAFSAILLTIDLVMGVEAWHRFLFLVVGLVLSGVAASYGILGVIRYGLFTEGCGAREVERELHLSRIAYAAGGIAQITLMVTIVLGIVLLVQVL